MTAALPARPNTPELRKLFAQSHKPTNPLYDPHGSDLREAAYADLEVFKYICSYYETYIASLMEKLQGYQKNSESILAELLEIKQAVYDLRKGE